MNADLFHEFSAAPGPSVADAASAGVPEESLRLLAEARAAAESRNDHEAVRCLRRALRIRPLARDPAARGALAMYLCQQAIALTNHVVHRMEESQRRLDTIFQAAFRSQGARSSDRCACCGCSTTSPYQHGKVMEFAGPEGERAAFCSECGGNIITLQGDLLCVDFQFGGLVRLAEQELLAALRLAPLASLANAPLQSVQAFMQSVSIESYKPRCFVWLGNARRAVRLHGRDVLKGLLEAALWFGVPWGVDYASSRLFGTETGSVYGLIFGIIGGLMLLSAICAWLRDSCKLPKDR